MKNVKLTKVMSALALAAVMAVSSCGGSSSNPAGVAVTYATQKSQCDVSLGIYIAENLVMAKYNMDVYVDDSKLGTYANGESFTIESSMAAGSHTLRCSKNGDSSVSGELTFRVTDDGQYINFSVKAHTDYIEISTF